MVIDLYKKTTLSDKIIAQCLLTLIWKDRHSAITNEELLKTNAIYQEIYDIQMKNVAKEVEA